MMQPDKNQSPHSYLQNVLNDGAKLFRYRNGICSLLGIAEDQKKYLTSGLFKYTYVEFLYAHFYAQKTHSSQNPLTFDKPGNSENNYSSGVSEKKLEYLQNNKDENLEKLHLEESKSGSLKIQNNKNRLNKKPIAQEITRQNNSEPLKPEGKQIEFSNETLHDISLRIDEEKNKILRTEISVQSSKKTNPDNIFFKNQTLTVADQNNKIKIPGKSEEKISFPALSLDKKIENSNLYSENQDEEDLIQNSTDQKEIWNSMEQHGKSDTMNYDIPNTKNLRESDTYNDGNSKTKNYQVKQPAGETDDLTGKNEKNRIYQKITTNLLPSKSNSPNANYISNSSGISALAPAENIERIRQSMQEYNSKKNQKTNENENQRKDSTTDYPIKQNIRMPAKQFVTINRNAKQRRMQCAFWERSYLGHHNMMPLR